MAEMMTDAQLSERVCKVLGIEPRNVLDWPGFGLVVERLREKGIFFTFSDNDSTPKRYFVELYPYLMDTEYGESDTLPRALALAVIEMEGR